MADPLFLYVQGPRPERRVFAAYTCWGGRMSEYAKHPDRVFALWFCVVCRRVRAPALPVGLQ